MKKITAPPAVSKCEKRGYETEHEAQVALVGVWVQFNLAQDVPGLVGKRRRAGEIERRTYYCTLAGCHLWHLTHQPFIGGEVNA